MIRIEKAELDSVDAVAHLFDAYRQFYKQDPDFVGCREYIKTRLANQESTIFIAVDESDKVVGFTQLYDSFCSVAMKPLIYLYDLFVAPEARRLGAAKLLMDRAKAYGLERGATRITLTTQNTNVNAQALYESLGYIKDDVFFAYDLRL